MENEEINDQLKDIPEKERPTQQEIDMCHGDIKEAQRINKKLVTLLAENHCEAVKFKFIQLFGKDYSTTELATQADVFKYFDLCISQEKGLDPEKIKAFRKYLLDIKTMIKRTWEKI